MSAAVENVRRRERYASDPEYRERRKAAAQGTRDGYPAAQRALAVERAAQWKRDNPAAAREAGRRASAAFRERYPDRAKEAHDAYVERAGEGRREARRVDKRRERLRDPERVRERERINGAKRRAKCQTVIVPLVVLEMDDGLCGICGQDVNPEEFHVDHILPLARGGEHCYGNVQVAHPRCNLSKRDSLPWEVR